MKMKHKLLLIGIAVFFCAVAGVLFNKELRIRRMLHQKYGESFVVQKIWREADGRTAFSNDICAYCYPKGENAHLFRITVYDFWSQDFYDTYPNSVIGIELQERMQEKLDVYFPECFVSVYAWAGTVEFDSGEEIALEEFVSRATDAGVRYRIGVNQDALESEDYSAECDFLFDCLAQINEECGISGTMGITFLPEDIYRKYRDHFGREFSFTDAKPEFVQEYPQFGMAFLKEDGSRNILLHGKGGNLTSASISEEEYAEMRQESD